LAAKQKDIDDAIAAAVEDLQPLIALHAAARAAIIDDIDNQIDTLIPLLERAARFGIPQTGWGFIFEWKRTTFASVLGTVGAIVQRWTTRLGDFTARIAQYDALVAG